MRLLFPPGGIYQVSGQSLANQHLIQLLLGGTGGGFRGGGGRRRRRRPLPLGRTPAARRLKRAVKRAGKRARLVKGSPEARRYMARLRARRRK